IRRAARHGFELGMKQPFFYQLVDVLCQEMGQAYPELVKAKQAVIKALHQEEERFAETLEHGMKILDEVLVRLDDTVIPGETVFKLYDTYGFPVDLTADIAQNKGLTLDYEGFESAMEAQRNRARAANHFAVDYNDTITVETETKFTGYGTLEANACVVQLLSGGKVVDALSAGEEGILVLDKTPFYAESGGQTGDTGVLSHAGVKILVTDTQKQGSNVFLHHVKVARGNVKVGDELVAQVDAKERSEIESNHSATHLLHAALRQVLGAHVQQKGSLVDADRLRFDFSHSAPMTAAEMLEVERIVNAQIRQNYLVEADLMTIDAAQKRGAMALFGEKYGAEVRVLSMGGFSIELCGGTHVKRTGDIGLLKIVSEAGVASGIRRIEALTAAKALAWIQETDRQFMYIAELLKSKRENSAEKITQLLEKQRKLEKELTLLKSKAASAAGSDLTANAQLVSGVNVVAAQLDGADVKSLRDTVDQLKNKLGTAAIVLASVDGEKVRLVAGVSKDATDRIKAGALVSMVAQQVGGKGGGRPDMAQAGGTDPSNLLSALASVTDWVGQQLN
ncbi:MAG TPA: alanine--tRNA ligase, partial [Gammaproteobacteria bacterium]|nr:alanine--tRNA ligase [Gammaproteobacteria bacterium]